jgi:hypothetical protein
VPLWLNYYNVFKGDKDMTSPTKKKKRIASWKDKPNKANLKANKKRVDKNTEILRELASKDKE